MRIDRTRVFGGPGDEGVRPYELSGNPLAPTKTFPFGERRVWLIDEAAAAAMLDPSDTNAAQRARLNAMIWRATPQEIATYHLPVWSGGSPAPVYLRELPDTGEDEKNMAFRKLLRRDPAATRPERGNQR